ncbi:MAG: hypothetical protein B6D68_03855 [spirochete symbiont of Stewartia floridana]|nr:MAG: hypothetical protein B6D68_03855 [spirochete symbiont of Stewartia floridana]
MKKTRLLLLIIAALVWFIAPNLAAESETRLNLHLYNTIYRGRANTWYYGANGLADLRFSLVGNKRIKAQTALEFFQQDISGRSEESTPTVSLKRLWVKADFPSWRLTVGKTKVAWGNGFVFNSGDVLFGSISPYLDFTQSTVRDDTAFLTAFNIPLGQFSFLEAVVLPPDFLDGKTNNRFAAQPLGQISGGMRFFTKIGGFHLEGGYLYKGDKKVLYDLLGHRPYLSFHGHAGVDFYGAVSMAAGYDSSLIDDQNRDTWDEISRTVNFSVGFFHQVQAGYDGTLSFRLESLIMPWQSWEAEDFLDILAGANYGIMIYPEIRWNFFQSAWTLSLQSIISPIDASAQITGSAGWQVFQGFTLLAYVKVNIGEAQSLFAWDRTDAWPYKGFENEWPESTYNGISFTLGAKYVY